MEATAVIKMILPLISQGLGIVIALYFIFSLNKKLEDIKITLKLLLKSSETVANELDDLEDDLK